MMNNSAIRYTFFIFSLLLLGTSCGTIKHLKEGETLLRKNKVVIKDKENVDDYSNLKYQLEIRAFQKPNSRFLGMPTLGPWYYYRMQSRQDTTNWTRFVNKNWVEEPAIYSGDLANASAQKMENYLYESGYFEAKVEFSTKIKGWRKKKTHVTYIIHPGNRYYLDSITYVSKDTAILKILNNIKGESFLKKGGPVSSVLYDLEKRRITDHLKNIGYANFYPNYFSKLQGDSIGNKVNSIVEVLLPKESTFHKKYKIGDISVISLFNENGDPIYGKDTLVNGVKFYVEDDKHYLKLKTIESKIFIKKGEVYKVNNFNKTRAQLGNLDIFQFVDVRRLPALPTDSVLNYEIRLIPKKRQQLGTDFELNNSRTVNSSNAFLGTAASLNYTNRNVFRGGEVFSARAEGGIEVVPKRKLNEFQVNAWNLNLSGNIDFPRYYDFTKTDFLLLRLAGERGRKFYKKLKEEGASRTSLGYNILANTGNYRIDRFAGSLGWRLRVGKNTDLAVSKLGIDFLDRTFTVKFDTTFVQNNPAFDRSLRPQLLTGFGLLFRDINILHRRDLGTRGKSSIFARANLEISGLEAYGINLLANQITGKDDTAQLFNKYEFSQYAKVEVDFRFYRKFKGGRLIATRFNTGYAWNYGLAKEIPYVKQFFAGGPLSMRAWQIRELGPGSYVDPAVSSATGNFYQTGEFKLEMNLEYRFNLFWYLKGAVFLDVGNVWTLQADETERPGSGLRNFFDEFAVGSGFGLRLDVDYFIISSDFGYKLRNPFPDQVGENWLLDEPLALNKFKWQLTVGYPF